MSDMFDRITHSKKLPTNGLAEKFKAMSWMPDFMIKDKVQPYITAETARLSMPDMDGDNRTTPEEAARWAQLQEAIFPSNAGTLKRTQAFKNMDTLVESGKLSPEEATHLKQKAGKFFDAYPYIDGKDIQLTRAEMTATPDTKQHSAQQLSAMIQRGMDKLNLETGDLPAPLKVALRPTSTSKAR